MDTLDRFSIRQFIVCMEQVSERTFTCAYVIESRLVSDKIYSFFSHSVRYIFTIFYLFFTLATHTINEKLYYKTLICR